MILHCDADDVRIGIIRYGSGFLPKIWVEEDNSECSEDSVGKPEDGAGPKKEIVFAEEDFNVAGYVRFVDLV